MVTSSSVAKGSPRLTLVKITTDGVEHTRQVDNKQIEAYDEQGVDYVKVDGPMTGMEHLPEPFKGAQPANKAAAPANKA